jgi:hypothetical protein
LGFDNLGSDCTIFKKHIIDFYGSSEFGYPVIYFNQMRSTNQTVCLRQEMFEHSTNQTVCLRQELFEHRCAASNYPFGIF